MPFLFLAPFLQAEELEIGPDTQIYDDNWQYLISFPMVWMPKIDGTIEADRERVDLKIPFKNIIDNLHFGIMGDLYAQKGRWLYSLRLNYLLVKSDTQTEGLSGPITGGIISPGHNFETTIHMAANDFLAGYEVTPGLRLLAGVRQIYSKLELDITPLSDDGFIKVNERINVSRENDFDMLVGLTYRYWFDDDWGISAGLDTKLFGQSDRNNGFNISVMYRLNEVHNIWIGYRYLHIGNDIEKEEVVQKTDFKEYGPQFGWAFRF